MLAVPESSRTVRHHRSLVRERLGVVADQEYARWDSMEDDDRYVFALRGLQEVHGKRIEVFYTGRGQTQSWMRDPYAFGEAAVAIDILFARGSRPTRGLAIGEAQREYDQVIGKFPV